MMQRRQLALIAILLLSVAAVAALSRYEAWIARHAGEPDEHGNESSTTSIEPSDDTTGLSKIENHTKSLEPVEIREYRGQRLSSIDDFRENSIKGTQYIREKSYRLTITGLVNNTSVYTYNAVLNNHEHYEKVVILHCVEGWDVTILWEGVLVADLINEVGIGIDAKVVIFYASDGYSTSLPLDYIIDNDIIMAYKMNGLALPPERGFPFQLVAESKLGYKWIKWITKIELSDDMNYRGYWESRGFSNEADWKP